MKDIQYWQKVFEEDFKRKDWSSEEWKNSEDRLDRIIYLITSYSPHNLWKAREIIRDYCKDL